MNEKMKQIGVEKITLNIGVGTTGDKLEKATKLLTIITGEKPVTTKAKKRIPTLGVRPGLPVGCKVTLRSKKAEEVLIRLLKANKNTIKSSKFDNSGNLSFGIEEYIDIPEVEYDISIGIIGLEVAITLERPGFRIKRRTIKSKTIPRKHRITKEEAIEFMKNKFGVKVV